MPRRIRNLETQQAFTFENHDVKSNRERIQAFQQRQQEDYRRYDEHDQAITRRTPFRERYQSNRVAALRENGDKGEEAWQNSEGERLKDFGLDEEAEFYDEDDIPLSRLLLRKRSNFQRSSEQRDTQ